LKDKIEKPLEVWAEDTKHILGLSKKDTYKRGFRTDKNSVLDAVWM